MEIKDWSYEEFRNYDEEVEGATRISTSGDETGVEYIPDIIYSDVDGIPLTLQILKPCTRNCPQKIYPLVVFVQGSAWMEQDVYRQLPQIARLAARGYVVAVVQYRHSGQAVFPAQIQDARTAVRFMRLHAGAYSVDAEHVIMAGDSSGGHTAVFAGMREPENCLGPEPYSQVRADVDGIIDMYGSVSVLQEDANPNTINHCLPDSPEGMLVGRVNLRENKELREKISAVTYIVPEKEIPPMLIIHGTKDFIVNTEQSVILYKKLKDCGKDAELYLLDGAMHGGAEFWTDRMLDIMDMFIKRCIGIEG